MLVISTKSYITIICLYVMSLSNFVNIFSVQVQFITSWRVQKSLNKNSSEIYRCYLIHSLTHWSFKFIINVTEVCRAHLNIYQKGVYYSGIKIFNSLPRYIETYIDNPRTFKKAVKKCLYTNPFYSLNEYYDNNIMITICFDL